MTSLNEVLSPGDAVKVVLKEVVGTRFLEDGPYDENGSKWITIADDEGEISSAEWNEERGCWIECD